MCIHTVWDLTIISPTASSLNTTLHLCAYVYYTCVYNTCTYIYIYIYIYMLERERCVYIYVYIYIYMYIHICQEATGHFVEVEELV